MNNLHTNRHYLHTQKDFSPVLLKNSVFWILSNVAPQTMRAVCVKKVRQLLAKCQNSSLKLNMLILSSPLSLHTHCICFKSINVMPLMTSRFFRAFFKSISFLTPHHGLGDWRNRIKAPKIFFNAGPRSYVESVARSAVAGGDQPTSTWSPSPPEETTGPQRSTSPSSYSLNPPLSSSSPIQSSQRWGHTKHTWTPDKT